MSKNDSFKKFIAGKGFYLALSVCLVGAATAAWVSINKTLTSIDENNKNILEQSSSVSRVEEKDWGFPDLEETGKEQSGVSVSSSAPSSPRTSSSSSKASKKPSTPSKASEKPQALAFVLPIDGEIFAPYSKGELVMDQTLKEWRTHNGIDIKANKNAAVYAVADGEVIRVEKTSMWGNVIEIKHSGNIISRYCGLGQDIAVKKGDKVKIKQAIGILDTIPSEVSLPIHLHFEMEKDGILLDPLEAMNKIG